VTSLDAKTVIDLTSWKAMAKSNLYTPRNLPLATKFTVRIARALVKLISLKRRVKF
jgi:hypothetical protein